MSPDGSIDRRDTSQQRMHSERHNETSQRRPHAPGPRLAGNARFQERPGRFATASRAVADRVNHGVAGSKEDDDDRVVPFALA